MVTANGAQPPNSKAMITEGLPNTPISVSITGFDISGVGSGGNGVGLAALQLEGESFSRLFTINLAMGAATQVGAIGGELVRAIAIAPPGFQFSAPTVSVLENDRSALVTVTRTGGSRGTATVPLSPSDGSALAGSDYQALSQVLTFADGETSKTVAIPILNDRTREPRETFNLTLSAPTGGHLVLGTVSRAIVTIHDNKRR